MIMVEEPKVYDLFAPESFRDPYPLYQRMRTEEPVYFAERYGYWVLTRHRDVVAALRDQRLSADRRSMYTKKLRGIDLGRIQNLLRFAERSMLEKDPPEHTPMRKMANAGFAVRALESWRPIVHDVTNRLLDAVQAQGHMDVVSDLARSLPAQIISDIFGVPEPDRPLFLQLGIDIATFWGAVPSNTSRRWRTGPTGRRPRSKRTWSN